MKKYGILIFKQKGGQNKQLFKGYVISTRINYFAYLMESTQNAHLKWTLIVTVLDSGFPCTAQYID